MMWLGSDGWLMVSTVGVKWEALGSIPGNTLLCVVPTCSDKEFMGYKYDSKQLCLGDNKLKLHPLNNLNLREVVRNHDCLKYFSNLTK